MSNQAAPWNGAGDLHRQHGEEFRISDPDWQVPTLPVGVEPAVTMPYHNFGNGTRIKRTTYVYLHAIPADPTRTIATLTLPGSDQGGRYHLAVLSLALR